MVKEAVRSGFEEPASFTSASKPFRYYPSLDGLRWLAFFGVFFHHCYSGAWARLGYDRSPSLTLRLLYSVAHAGAYGVPIFFALSGFLITGLLVKEKFQTETISIKAFLVRRTLRIWPLYYLAIFAAAMTAAPDHRADLAYILFYGNWLLVIRSAFGSVFWSLCVEEQFYLVWPWVAKFCSTQNLVRVSVGLILFSMIFRLGTAWHGGDWRMLWYATFDHLDSLGAGALLAIFLDRLPRCRFGSIGIWFLIGTSLGSLVAISYFAPILSRTWTITWFGALLQSIPPAASVAIIWALATKRDEVRVLQGKPVLWLGKISFGLYLFHMLFLDYSRNLLEGRVPHSYLLFGPALALAISIGFAFISFRYYEQPFLNLKRKFLSKAV